MRLSRAPLAYVQPEMGHTGVSQFLAITKLAEEHGAAVIPHATIGVGIFMAASLHAAVTLPNCPYHEYQHSVFDQSIDRIEVAMRCESGQYTLPEGAGLGVLPTSSLSAFRLSC